MLGGGAKLPMTTRGGPTTRATSAGLAGKFVASNGDCITNQGFSQGLSPPIVTIVVASTGASTGTVRSIFGVSGYGSRYTGICASAAGNTWEYRYGGSSTAVLLTSTAAFSDDDLCVIVGVSYSSSNHELYVNGKLEATSTVSGGGDPALDSLTVGCGNGERTWNLRANGLIAFGAIGQGILSRGSVSNLALNPWQIFAPRETRLFVPVSSIGGSYTLTAQAGIYSLTGQPAQLLKSKLLTSSGGTYQHVGADASLYRSKQLSLSGGSYSISGASADITFTGLSANFTLTAQGGIYNLSGSAADITYTALSPSYLLTAQGGTYTLSGNSIDLRKSKRLTASGGGYSYTGQQVNITAGPAVVSTLVKYINVLTGEILLLQPF